MLLSILDLSLQTRKYWLSWEPVLPAPSTVRRLKLLPTPICQRLFLVSRPVSADVTAAVRRSSASLESFADPPDDFTVDGHWLMVQSLMTLVLR